LECASYKVLAQAKENKIIRSGFYLLGEQTLLCRVNARGLGHSRRNNGSLKPEAEGLLFSWNNPGPKAFLTFKNNFFYHVSGWVGNYPGNLRVSPPGIGDALLAKIVGKICQNM